MRDSVATGRIADDDARLLLESVDDYAIFLLDVNGHVVTWNRGAARIKGYEPKDIVGKHFSVFYPPEDVRANKPERELEIARAVGRVEDEGYRLRKDGTRFWANVVITTLYDAQGNLRGYGKITRDLSERRRFEEELRASDQRFDHLVDAVTDYAILMLDRSGLVSTWNIGASRIKQYSAQEIIGAHFSVFYPQADRDAGRPAKILDQVLRSGRFEEEGYRVRKDGSLFWASVVITAWRDTRGEVIGFVKVTRDLTERRLREETERQLLREQVARVVAEASERTLRESELRAVVAAKQAEDAAKSAEAANRLKDEFLATISHELRTPLNSIVGWSFILREKNSDPLCAPAVEAIHRSAQAQARIIDDILDVSRIITGKLSLEMGTLDLAEMVYDALDVVRPSANAKQITISFERPVEKATLVGDPDRLRQVVWNLLSNAVKFTDKGGSVVVTLSKVGQVVSLGVRDTGRGIEAAMLPHVFERFTQADSSSTRRFGGLGLGLAIVRHVVELHGGTVHAKSEGAGKGAEFRVELPSIGADAARSAIEPRESAHEPDGKVPRRALGGARIIIVDDDEDARYLLETLLVTHGARVSAAESTAAAMDLVDLAVPSAIICDVAMPVEDGLAFMRRLRARSPEAGGTVAALALTAFATAKDRSNAMSAGFDAYLAKPATPEHIVATVAQLLAQNRSR